jgi:hypothetical protein
MARWSSSERVGFDLLIIAFTSVEMSNGLGQLQRRASFARKTILKLGDPSSFFH